MGWNKNKNTPSFCWLQKLVFHSKFVVFPILVTYHKTQYTTTLAFLVSQMYKYPYLSNVNSFDLEERDIRNVGNEKIHLVTFLHFSQKFNSWGSDVWQLVTQQWKLWLGWGKKWKYTAIPPLSTGYKNSFSIQSVWFFLIKSKPNILQLLHY